MIGYPHRYYLPSKPGPRAHDAALAALQASEEKLARQEEGAGPDAGVGLRLPITPHDAAFLVDDVFRGRSVVSGLASRLVLVRWRRPEPGAGSIVARVDSGGVDGAVDGPGAGAGGGGVQKSSNVRFRDLVCMTKEEAAVHEREVLRGNKQPEELYGADVVERVTARMAEAREWEQYRM